jgi:hypothetical protein
MAGFSHNFQALTGQVPPVLEAFKKIEHSGSGIADVLVSILQPSFSFVGHYPTEHQRAMKQFHAACGDLAKELLEKLKTDDHNERSVVSCLSE